MIYITKSNNNYYLCITTNDNMFALVDCNSFFCSVEKVFNPGLDGKPVFDSFFIMKNNLREEYNKIEEKERDKTNKRRPIGFNVSAE